MTPQYHMIVMNISMAGHLGLTPHCIHTVLNTIARPSFTLLVLWNHDTSVSIVTKLLVDDCEIIIVV